jgi:hypothetical protein
MAMVSEPIWRQKKAKGQSNIIIEKMNVENKQSIRLFTFSIIY